MLGLGAAAVNVEAFVAHLAATGRTARVLPASSAWGAVLEGPRVELQGSPIDFVTLRMKSASFVGAFPFVGRAKATVEYRFSVVMPGAYPWLRARLVLEKRGFFPRTRVGATWTGALLGPRFAEDPVIANAVAEHVRDDDALSVEADPDRGRACIVHARAVVVELSIFKDDLAEVRREQPSPELLSAFERMAVHLRSGRKRGPCTTFERSNT